MGVTGIGGIFFRSRDPEGRAAWYREHLGIDAGPQSVWQVTGLDALVARLDAAGIPVERQAEWESEYGRFVRIHDPEVLPLELWELPETG